MALVEQRPLRIAAIRFLNPAPLMWDFEHPPQAGLLASRYHIDWMLPSECADRLASADSDLGLIPIAALATTPGMQILPGCTIASKGRVRSLLLVHRTHQPLAKIRTVAADTASRTTVAYTRLLFLKWGNPDARFLPMAANLDRMLDNADAAILIGDPALLALEESANQLERTGQELVYLDLAEQWRTLTGLPFVSAVWAAPLSISPARLELAVEDLVRSRDHGLANIDSLAAQWSRRLPLPEDTIRHYLSENIHYILDEECIEGMRGFFREAAQANVLPAWELEMPAAFRA